MFYLPAYMDLLTDDLYLKTNTTDSTSFSFDA